MISPKERYLARGVSSTKDEVYDAISILDQGLYPGAFCTIVPDFAGEGSMSSVMHTDDVGTKTSLAYIAWRENFGDQIWFGIAQDCAVMNLDDCACVGATGPFWFSNTIARNAKRIPGSILKAILDGYHKLFRSLSIEGIECNLLGGETSDCGDIVRTLFVESTVMARLRREQVIDASRILPGDLIVSFSSYGQARWEDRPNSGIGSNGLTDARHQMLSGKYADNYPETFAPEVDRNLIYCGKYSLQDPLPGDSSLSIGEALLSPTRTYLPMIKLMLSRMPAREIHALIHCTGGGQTKIIRYGGLRGGGLRYVKERLLPIPPIFQALKESTGQSLWEMYKVYNMGALLEAVVPEVGAESCLAAAKECHIDATISGYVERTGTADNEVIIRADGEVHRYNAKT